MYCFKPSNLTTMEMSEAVILKLEKLARLQLSAEERKRLGADLQKMLAMVDKLQSLDTAGVEPLIYLNEENVEPASDLPAEPLNRDAVFKNAPQHNGTYFLVPKVIKATTDGNE